MKTKRFLVRISVILAFILTQSLADSGVNLTQNMADLSANQVQDSGDSNKDSHESSIDLSNSTFAPPKSDFYESRKLNQIAIQMSNPHKIHTMITKS